jgi:hypothetical protein
LDPKNDRLFCASCSSQHWHRSRTRVWERPLRLVFLRPYRCRDCGHRQYSFARSRVAALPHQPHSSSEARFASSALHASAWSMRMGDRRETMLIAAGLLVCVSIVALSSLRFRSMLLIRDSLRMAPFSFARLWFTRRTYTTHQESGERISIAVKPPQAEPSAGAAQAPSSVQTAEPRSSGSRAENTRGSSSAEAIRALRPKLPKEIKSVITSDNTVGVQVRIDESGEVVGATAISTSGPVAKSLVYYALETARRWHFRPARQNGTPVRSEKVLEFLFRPSDS